MHVLDASRVVDVVSSLLSDERRAGVRAGEPRAAGRRCGEQHSARRERPLLPYAGGAREPAHRSTGRASRCPSRAFIGRRVLADVPLDELVPYIDWTFFFAAWELKGRFPAILDHPQYGAAARELYDNARVLLDRIVREQLLTAQRRLRLLAGGQRGRRHRRLPRSASSTGELVRFNMLRQQEAIADGKPNLSLADFVAPRASARPHRLHRRVRGDRRPRRRRARARASSASTTTTTRSSSRRSPIGWPKRSPRTCTHVARRSGASTRRVDADDDPRGDASRHPPGVRLSRVSRSQREVQAVRSARRRRRRAWR